MPKNTLPSIGEGMIDYQTLQNVAPDVTSLQSMRQLLLKRRDAKRMDKQISPLLKDISQKLGGKSTTRVKNMDVMLQKVGQKRMQGDKTYNVSQLNDTWGGRIIVPDKEKIPDAIKAVKEEADDGKFDIVKEEHRKDATYDAYHIDIKAPNGGEGEIQIMTPQQEANSAFDHDSRYVFGEDVPDNLDQLRKGAKKVIDQLPNDKASQFSEETIKQRKANQDQPLPPIQPLINLAQVAKQ